ncbi:HAD family hydrolase [Ningiella sp. W23]|uniref:HAD family hydrolase n=1 Tax=Ningiella sp. W23 TaxID=3023715 RepID=UPI0037579412
MDSKLITLEDFGYQFLGPMCTQYFYALREMIKDCETNHEPPPFLVFLAREGYFFKQAFDALVQQDLMPNIERVYLRVSRTFLFRICIGDERTWDISLGHKYKGTLESLLTHRFGFSGNQARQLFDHTLLEEEVVLPSDIEKIKHYFQDNLKALNALTLQSMTDYTNYLRELGLNKSQTAMKPFMIDLGYSGTIQKLLTILLGRDTRALYFMTTDAKVYDYNGAKAQMDFVFKNQVNMGDGYALLDKSLFLESLLTSPNGQFLDIYARHHALGLSGKYQFVYGRESYAQTHFLELASVHKGAIEAVVHNIKNGIEYTSDEIECLFQAYTEHRHMMPACTHPLFDVDDAISGNGNVNPLHLFRL